MEERWIPSPEQTKKILKARAEALAREPEENTAVNEPIEIVEFLLAHERYGIESSYVGEVYPLKEFTPLPCTPAFVLGVVNVRGKMTSVIDMRKFFGLPDGGLTDLNKVIVVRAGAMELGILADRIVDARSVPLRDLQTSLPTLTDIRAAYLKGVTRERLIVLDAEKILSDPKIALDQQTET
ncbi:MAG: purine-binding chemotaxis protein CheW [Acidobacteria bacterium]|nr:purine-binding chemotaxis protein CheW [Acidobacteriota bacterium]